MSLISEALKKAEKKREDNKETIRIPLPPEKPGKEKKFPYSIIFILIILLIIPVIFSYIITKKERSSKVNMKTAEILSTIRTKKTGHKLNTKNKMPIPSQPEKTEIKKEKEKVNAEPETQKFKSSLSLRREPEKLVTTEERNLSSPENENKKSPNIMVKFEKPKESCSSIMNEGNFQKAENCFSEEMKNGETENILTSYGICELKLRKWKNAEQAFKKALKMDSTSSLLWFNYGISLFRQEKFNEAERAFSLALRMTPSVCESQYYLGLTNDLAGEKEQALYHYKLSLGCDLPPNIRTWVIKRITELIK